MKYLLNSLNEMVEDTMTKAFNRYANVQCNESKEKIPFEDLLPFMKSGSSQTKIWDKDTGKMLSLAEATAIARDALARGDKMCYDEIKKQMPAITIHASFNGIRNLKTPHTLTEYLGIDFDDIEAEHCKRIIEQAKQIAEICLCMTSLSNRGIHVFVCVKNLTDENFKIVYEVMASYISIILGVEYDKACSDITRLMILNHDPDCYVNENAEVIDANEVMSILNALNAIPADSSIGLPKYLDKVDQDVAMIPGVRHRNLLAYITPRLNRAGFEKGAVIEECVTRYSEPDFQRKEITEIIEYIYEHNKDEFGKNKKAYSFKQRLVETLKGQKAQKSKSSLDAEREDEEVDTDSFFAPIYAKMPVYAEYKDMLPRLFQYSIDDKQFPDIQWAMLMSLIAAFGGMPIDLWFYSDKKHYPIFSVMWYGESGSGKGQIGTVREVTNLYINAIRKRQQEEEILPAKEAQKQYDDCMAQWKAGDKKTPCDCGEKPVIPEEKHLMSSAQTSQSQLTLRCAKNLPFTTYCFTEEVGNANDNRKQKYGIQSAFLRDLIEGATVISDFKTSDYCKVDHPRFVLIAGGTPSAVQSYIDNQEDGFSARFIYVILEQHQYVRLKDRISRTAESWDRLEGCMDSLVRYALKTHMEVTFDETSINLLEDKCDKLSQTALYYDSPALASVAQRLLPVSMSMCACLAFLDACDNNIPFGDYTTDKPRRYPCPVKFVQLVLSWLDYIFYTSARVIMPLPKGDTRKLTKRDVSTARLLDELSCVFTTQELYDVFSKHKMSQSTAKRTLAKWINSKLVEKTAHGKYHKIGCVEEVVTDEPIPTPEPLHHWDY